jgi:hypothetical protein
LPGDSQLNVRFVPISGHLGPYSIALSGACEKAGRQVSPSVLQFSPKSVQPMDFLCLAVVSDLPISMALIGKP